MHCKLLENQVYIAPDGRYRMCCISLESDNKEAVNTHSLQEWLGSDTIKTAKQQLSGGVWPDACRRCKVEEESGVESRRIKKDWYGPGISHLDLRFGNNCNLQCISCNPRSSSSIGYETIEMSNNGIIPINPVPPLVSLNWYDEKYFSYFEGLPLKEVYLTGGEPMMVQHLPQFLKRLDQNVTIRFNTNATIYNQKLVNILKKFKDVRMNLSIDAIGRKIEYIRYGSRWKTIEDNAKRYSDFCTVDIGPTISILNALYYDEIKEWSDRNNFKIFENILMDPAWLNVKHAPDSLKEKFTYVGTLKDEDADIQLQKEFIKNISKLDSHRNIKIKDYLPEVATAYGIN